MVYNMTKLDGKTPDLAAENIEQLRQIFPDVFEEGNSFRYFGETQLFQYSYSAAGWLNDLYGGREVGTDLPGIQGLQVPMELAEHKYAIVGVCKRAAGGLNIKPANDKRPVHLNKERFLSEDFKELWDRIKYKTTYKVEFDSEKLVEQCCEKMQQDLNVGAAKLIYTKAKVQVSEGGVDTTETQRLSVMTTDGREQLPDVVTYLQNRSGLTRKTIVKILTESKTLNLFKKNPQAYMDQAAKLISSTMQLFIVDGIKYTKLGDTEYYAQELFDAEELTGYLERNMFESHRSVYDYVVYDSDVERGFAERLENNESVKVYAKLPDWFKVPTPLGNYNPDFVVETKGSVEGKDLRPTEQAKIKCGEKHFMALGNDAKFVKADSFQRFTEKTV